NHPFPDDPRPVLETRLVKQVAGCMRRLVVLPREVREMLPTGREHDAVDLRPRTLARQRDFLVDLREPPAEAADRPLQRGIGGDEGTFATEVPGPRVPVLDVDEPEPGAATHEELDRSTVEGGSTLPVSASGFPDERRL